MKQDYGTQMGWTRDPDSAAGSAAPGRGCRAVGSPQGDCSGRSEGGNAGGRLVGLTLGPFSGGRPGLGPLAPWGRSMASPGLIATVTNTGVPCPRVLRPLVDTPCGLGSPGQLGLGPAGPMAAPGSGRSLCDPDLRATTCPCTGCSVGSVGTTCCWRPGVCQPALGPAHPGLPARSTHFVSHFSAQLRDEVSGPL